MFDWNSGIRRPAQLGTWPVSRALDEAGAWDIDATAEQLRLLYDGSMVAAQLDHTPEPAKRTRDVARLLLDSVTS